MCTRASVRLCIPVLLCPCVRPSACLICLSSVSSIFSSASTCMHAVRAVRACPPGARAKCVRACGLGDFSRCVGGWVHAWIVGWMKVCTRTRMDVRYGNDESVLLPSTLSAASRRAGRGHRYVCRHASAFLRPVDESRSISCVCTFACAFCRVCGGAPITHRWRRGSSRRSPALSACLPPLRTD